MIVQTSASPRPTVTWTEVPVALATTSPSPASVRQTICVWKSERSVPAPDSPTVCGPTVTAAVLESPSRAGSPIGMPSISRLKRPGSGSSGPSTSLLIVIEPSHRFESIDALARVAGEGPGQVTAVFRLGLDVGVLDDDCRLRTLVGWPRSSGRGEYPFCGPTGTTVSWLFRLLS